ncbi:uncharacterized protein LOC114726283 [Neltuma alba]|uniref:uncharacterized protein LOC114726283 n=1 Tax=Neltuma alba TaxID=207710 RepID=UPI0010A3B834|nr:uncharacterized protein LOC114726283 [Prosopis alba]
MEKEGNIPQQSHSSLCSCLGSLVLSTILVLFFLFSLFLFFPLSESSWPVLLTIPIVLLSTLFLVVTLRKNKGSEDERLAQEEMQKEELRTELALINEQEAESQSDSSFPSDSESTNGSAMDEKFEQNAENTSLPSDAETESINGETDESLELDQNSTGVLGIYESLASDNEGEEDDDDDLIEINLPSSHFLSKELSQRLESKLPDFLPEAMFKEEGLMELLAEINEMNEDENLIEIDISMGSSNTATYQDLRLKQEMPFSADRYSVVTDQ